jgi:glycosyltransferase involved in cell wall biosynthesis
MSEIGAKRDRLKVAFIGRYERRKGVEELTTVMKRMSADLIDFNLIGPIPDNKKLTQANITYHGLIKGDEEIQGILDDCDILVVPSMAEGMPTVILEGMARGLAIIASDVGAVNTEVSEANGWLMKAGSEADLYSYLHAAMIMPEAALLDLKKASRDIVEDQFLWKRIIDLTVSQIETDLNTQR